MRLPASARSIALAFAAAPLLLIGCSGLQEPPASAVVAPPPAPPAASAGPAVVPVGEHRVARAYLWPGQAFVPGGGEMPNGVLLLRAGDATPNAAVCDAFVSTLAPETEIRAEDPAARIVSTFWLMKTNAASTGLNDCATLLSRYDFTRAATERARYGLMEVAGPALLLVQDDGRYVAMSFAASSPADIAVILPAWFDTVVQSGLSTRAAPGQPTVSFVVASPVNPTVQAPAAPEAEADAWPPSVADLACAAAQHARRTGGPVISLIGAFARSLVCKDEDTQTAA